MKVAVFSDSYHPYVSGVVRSIDLFQEELVKRGVEFIFFIPAYGNHQKEKGVYRFYSIPAPTNKEFHLALPFSPKIYKTLREEKVDLIHVHSPFLLGRLGQKAGRQLNIPVVFTYHTLYEEYVHYFPLARKAAKWVTSWYTLDFANKCSAVICPTEAIKEYLQEKGLQARSAVIPTGIDLEPFAKADRRWLKEKLGLVSKKVCLFVGRVAREKNVDFLLESFKIVALKLNEVVLVIVGGGPELPHYQKKAEELGLKDKVIFFGPVAPEEVSLFYAGADLFLFPSVTETQGLVFAEAKAAGLPTVGVKAFGSKSMVFEGVDGFLTSLNLQEYAEKVIFLLEQEEVRKDFSQKALQNAQNFSKEYTAKLMFELYQSLLK
ncbi:glycosyltransferase family 4 protein [Carboxydothermus pertinax]|uniref:Glycosyl transferase n=1 Tax=Carboxydothermus pertinax TaxID=870242 RepID=A0A1L8CUG4_9THEO|nr:glycosyltransferase family 4 protein [Carboxydothermus pertinax]GAV22595.1 glycosyl transferase [Carboxydothermus pertinax]